MSGNLPPISYKLHPKMHEIIEQKRKRRQILERERQKIKKEEQTTRRQKKKYFEASKNQIQLKKQAIYTKKLTQRNKIREQEKQRQIRIQSKKAQRLQKFIPQRAQIIHHLKEQYIRYIQQKDQIKRMKIKQRIEKDLEEAQKQLQNCVSIEVRIKEQNLIDVNEGQCILCLSSQAQIYMTECRHLISCPQCEFILRMQKKCPVCRKCGNYKNLNQIKKGTKRKNSCKK